MYYTPPEEELFIELKEACVTLWETYDNTYGYVDEKVNRIKDLENVGDNFMYMFAMFDIINQNKILSRISDECSKALIDRLLDGGMTEEELIRYYPILNN